MAGSTATQYQHLEPRPGSSYRQLFLKGRRIRAAIVHEAVYGPDPYTPEEFARDYGVPLEAVLEALDYVSNNLPLVEAERDREAGAVQSWSCLVIAFIPVLLRAFPPLRRGGRGGVMKSRLGKGPRGDSKPAVFVARRRKPPHPPFGHPLPKGAREIEAGARVFPVPLAPLGRGVRGEGAGYTRGRNREESHFTARPTFHHPRAGVVAAGTSKSVNGFPILRNGAIRRGEKKGPLENPVFDRAAITPPDPPFARGGNWRRGATK